MASVSEHNSVLQQKGNFSSSDLEENKQKRYSKTQLERFENERAYIRSTASKYENKNPLISLIFGFGFLLFVFVLYFVGVFEMLQNVLGALFLPAMIGAALLAGLLIFVIIPRQYQASVDMYKGMGTSLPESPLGEIQVIEARAQTRRSQGGINRRGHQSSKISHVLQMDSIEFLISESFFEVIQPKRLYRVYAVKDQGVWTLLSMETLE
jgi:hypothetical protein